MKSVDCIFRAAAMTLVGMLAASATASWSPPAHNNWEIIECTPPEVDADATGMINCWKGDFTVPVEWDVLEYGAILIKEWEMIDGVPDNFTTSTHTVNFVPTVTWTNTSSLKTISEEFTGAVANFRIDPDSYSHTNHTGTITFTLDPGLDCMEPPPQAEAEFTGVMLDLDVTNDTTLSKPEDGIANYLPGYEGTFVPDNPISSNYEPVISSANGTFLEPGYQGQAMTLVLQGVGKESGIDEVIFEIVSTTGPLTPGFCGNATHASIEAAGTRDDYSFKRFEDSSDEEGRNYITITPECDPESDEHGGQFEDDRVWTRFWAKDYGGSCEVMVTAKSGGEALFTCSIRIPVDTQLEGIADIYLAMQEAQWEAVYNWENAPSWPGENLTANYDEEPMNPDGLTGDHKTTGDGLTAFEEYRGFILDHGPEHEGGHKRLSFSRKELLVQVWEMPDIQNAIAVGENQDVADRYSLNMIYSNVTDFYNDKERGAGIDVYWVRTGDVPLMPVAEEDLESVGRENAKEWTNDVLKRSDDGVATSVAGGMHISRDLYLREEHEEVFDEYFNSEVNAVADLMKNIKDEMPPELSPFVRLALVSRWGPIHRPAPEGNPYGLPSDEPWPLAENAGPAWANISGDYEYDGAVVGVAGTAEEWPWKDGPRHLNADEFEGLLSWSVAHELGHLLAGPDHRDDVGYLMGPTPRPNGINETQVHEDTRKSIDVKGRFSVPPVSN